VHGNAGVDLDLEVKGNTALGTNCEDHTLDVYGEATFNCSVTIMDIPDSSESCRILVSDGGLVSQQTAAELRENCGFITEITTTSPCLKGEGTEGSINISHDEDGAVGSYGDADHHTSFEVDKFGHVIVAVEHNTVSYVSATSPIAVDSNVGWVTVSHESQAQSNSSTSGSVTDGGTFDTYQSAVDARGHVTGTTTKTWTLDGVKGDKGDEADKHAIVEGFTAGRFIGLTCVEMPEVRFEDVITIRPEGKDSIKFEIDKEFLHVCEENSIEAIGYTTTTPCPCGIIVEGNFLNIKFLNHDVSIPEKVIVRISGIRKGRARTRFPEFTEEERRHNSQFWGSWRKNK
jgi:hypothetical protein